MKSEYLGFYYLHLNNDPMVITVCLLLNAKHVLSRGLAIRSKLDYPNRKIGRAVAIAAARRANGTQSNFQCHPTHTTCMRAWAAMPYLLSWQHTFEANQDTSPLSRYYAFNKGLYDVKQPASQHEAKIIERLHKNWDSDWQKEAPGAICV